MNVPCPLGDVVDRITILQLKLDRLDAPDARGHVRRQLDSLLLCWRNSGHPPVETLPWTTTLAQVNTELWEVEEALRKHEAEEDFGEQFIARARSVYKLNDRRAGLKQAINRALGSSLLEQKSYAGSDP